MPDSGRTAQACLQPYSSAQKSTSQKAEVYTQEEEITMDIRQYCRNKYKAEETHPFGPWPICFKVGGKIFAQLYPNILTLKCPAFQGQLFRDVYRDIVTRGYHCPASQQPYWNTLDLSRFPEAELPHMIDLAYSATLDKFSRKQRLALLDPIGRTVTVTVDRPLGSIHPKHKDIRYEINYGYIPGIYAGDGEEQDAYILGVDTPVSSFTGQVVAIIHRLNDVEDKWVVAPEGITFTAEEIQASTHFQEQYFQSLIYLP